MRQVIQAKEDTFGPFTKIEDKGDHWLADGVKFPKDALTEAKVSAYTPPVVKPSPDSLIRIAYAHMDAVAQREGFRDILDAVSFSSSSELSYARVGASFVLWRDQVKIQLDKALVDGIGPEAFLKSIPVLQYPDGFAKTPSMREVRNDR